MFWNPCRWKVSDKIITGESCHRSFVQTSETSNQKEEDESVCPTWNKISAIGDEEQLKITYNQIGFIYTINTPYFFLKYVPKLFCYVNVLFIL